MEQSKTRSFYQEGAGWKELAILHYAWGPNEKSVDALNNNRAGKLGAQKGKTNKSIHHGKIKEKSS